MINLSAERPEPCEGLGWWDSPHSNKPARFSPWRALLSWLQGRISACGLQVMSLTSIPRSTGSRDREKRYLSMYRNFY
jgi:hypothetical protein